MINFLINNIITIKFMLIAASWILAFFVVSVRSAIHSVLGLILLFIVTALMFIGFFNLYFIGVLFIIVYIGAVTVLFLFIIIIIPLRENTQFPRFSKLLGGCVFFILLVVVLLYYNINVIETATSLEILPAAEWFNFDFIINDVQIVSKTLYYQYSFALVVAALLLFVALIIAIILCLRI